MKNIIILLTLLLCLDFAMGQTNTEKDTIDLPAAADSTTYALHIADPGFDIWFTMNKKPVNFYDLKYYEMKNEMYARHWNQRVTQHGWQPPYDSYIDYNPNVAYGLPVNYKLYYYFRYLEDKLGIKLSM